MTKQITISVFVALTLAATTTQAQLFDLADTSDLSLSHVTGSELTPPGNYDLGNGIFTHGTLVTDGSANTATFVSGVFTSSDWGGTGTFTSDSIDISAIDTIDILAQYDGLFNTPPTEFSNFFYILDGGSTVTFGAGIDDANASNVAATVTSLDVSGASSLVVGFSFNHNGASDFFNVDSLIVNAVPEPSAYALIGGLLALTSIMIRRRR